MSQIGGRVSGFGEAVFQAASYQQGEPAPKAASSSLPLFGGAVDPAKPGRLRGIASGPATCAYPQPARQSPSVSFADSSPEKGERGNRRMPRRAYASAATR